MDERPFESINVIPFVDIMLVLLAIVLTTASFISSGRIPVSLPQVAKAEVERKKERVIGIAANGELYLDGKATSKDALEQLLQQAPADTPVAVRADREVRFQSFVDVADILKRLKITKVAVQTESSGR